MRKSLLLLSLGLFLFCGVTESIYAQNPKQSKKYKKKAKKQKKPKSEPLDYSPSKKKDNDGDGVPNYYDHCPDTPEGQRVTTFGCPPDSDRDGLFDYEDKCPDTKGPRKNKGCPYEDTDGDGILDIYDRCVDVPGPKKWGGCGDKDGDGVPDYEDKCPDIHGWVGLKGCPKEEEDTDKDGILDKEDKCPFIPGPAHNQGCPEFTAEEKRILQAAFDNLLFESGSAIIAESSYESLNGLAGLMDRNGAAKLYIEGHTDNVGDDDKNMQLSIDRAHAVKKYIMDTGIDAGRLTSAGYGETRPVDTNDTSEGRTKNRRVVMELSF